MKTLTKFFITIPIMLLTGCALSIKSSKQGPDSLKENKHTQIHFGTSTTDG